MFKATKQGAINVVSGEIPLTEEQAGELYVAFEPCLSSGQPRAVLNLQQVPLIDSAGLECLLDLQEHFQKRAGTLKLAAPSPLCREILNVTGVARHFEIFSDVTSAVGSFA